MLLSSSFFSAAGLGGGGGTAGSSRLGVGEGVFPVESVPTERMVSVSVVPIIQMIKVLLYTRVVSK